MDEYSKEAMMVMEELSDKDIKQMQKENPFRVERNDKLRNLARRGVAYMTLAEISGLSKAMIGRICRGSRKTTE